MSLDTPSFSLLETGDLLLAINSTPATTFHDVTKRIYDAELDLVCFYLFSKILDRAILIFLV